MSKFKKMKLIDYDDDQDRTLSDIMNNIKLSSTSYLRKASNLDNEIQKILNENIDDYQKIKLYSNALVKFLKAKRKFEGSDKISEAVVATEPLLTEEIKEPIKKIKKKKVKKLKQSAPTQSITPQKLEKFENMLKTISKSKKGIKYIESILPLDKPTSEKFEKVLEKAIKMKEKTPSKSKLMYEQIKEFDPILKPQKEEEKLEYELNPFLRKPKLERTPVKQLEYGEKSNINPFEKRSKLTRTPTRQTELFKEQSEESTEHKRKERAAKSKATTKI